MRSPWLKVGLPLGAAALIAGGLAVASQLVGEAVVLSPDGRPVEAAPHDGGLDAGADEPAPPDAGAPDASWRYDRQGALVRPPADEDYRCRQPAVEIEASEGCAAGRPYPHCRWRLPDPEGDAYEIWRNTTDDHRWARPGLVSLLLATAAEYQRRWPGEHVTIGDLDAPGPRHQTHDRGVDVDMYLLESMIARNEGGGRYPDNYEGRSRAEVRSMRARVMDLGKILATCANGQIRIYYNDPDVVRPFRAWFDERGYVSEVGNAMQMHNELHRFHYHLTVADSTEPLPTE
ncbi:MAG: penicillin-insensitive murein endopeptidase [Sandaracinaceae bacterium]|nr:penicillin-insensitive murein endopeptidase [Sandaracinaceae bacterium]